MSHFLRSVLFAVFVSSIVYSVSAQYLHAEGTKIVDGDGQEVIWRGIGLGGWMLQEGYMLRTSGAQHEIEAKIEDLVGEQKKSEFYEAWLANHTQKIDVDSLASWGYNMIRLPMHYKLFTPPIEEEPVAGEVTWLEKGFEMTDSLLAWCKANNMYLILDLHAAPGGQGENADISDYDPSRPSLWESEANKDKMIALWRKLAERYANEPMLGAYDIVNEPNWGFQDHANDLNGCAESQNTPLWDLQKKITEAIREVDQNHIIVIEGNCWGNNYNGLPTLWDDNLVISYHKYWNGNNQNNIQGMLDMRTNRNVPIWLGETGENSNTWFTNAVSLFESNNMGWAWWPLKKLGGNNPLQIKTNPGYQKILDFWSGNGVKPTADEAFDGLMGLAENLKLENNIYHQDVVDAKIRQPHTDQTIPFKPHRIEVGVESVVHATDFDLGKSEFAYSDTEVTNTTGNPGGQAWNLGYSYRNDGVDIEGTSDDSEFSNGYNVGWTQDGEWMQYTVKVDSSAAYRLTIRYAGQTSGAGHIEIDGADVTGPIQFEATGGYQVWVNKEIPDLALYEGSRKLRFVIDKGGMNLGYFSFFLTKSLTEVSFLAVSAKTDEAGQILLDLNKQLDAESLTTEGFSVLANGVAVAVSNISSVGKTQLQLKLSEGLLDSDEIQLSYSGNNVLSTDGAALAAFEGLMVVNNLPYHAVIPGKIEAEDFVFNNGLELETTSDIGGGQNIGYTNSGDYLDYDVNIKHTGKYTLEVRVACDNNAGTISFQQLSETGAVLNSANVEVPVTGDWQSWETVSTTINLEQSRGTLRMKIIDPEFNVNWFSFTEISDVLATPQPLFQILYPNPAKGTLRIKLNPTIEQGTLKLITVDGKAALKTNFQNAEPISIEQLAPGLYFAEIIVNGLHYREKLLIGE